MREIYPPSLKYNKGRNALYRPDTDAPEVQRIIRCLGDSVLDTPINEPTGCKRMVVEYRQGDYLAPTFHRDGLPEGVMKIAIDAGAAVVNALCDHHGGNPYERYAELIPSAEKDAV